MQWKHSTKVEEAAGSQKQSSVLVHSLLSFDAPLASAKQNGVKAGRDITRFDHTSTNTNAPGSQVSFFFLLPRTITLRNRFHHRTQLHRTDSPSQQGVLERNADGVKPEGDTEVAKTAARRRCTHRRAGEDSVTQPTGKQEESWRLGRSALVKKPESALF